MLENMLQLKQSDLVVEFGWSAVKEIGSELEKGGCLWWGKKKK